MVERRRTVNQFQVTWCFLEMHYVYHDWRGETNAIPLHARADSRRIAVF